LVRGKSQENSAEARYDYWIIVGESGRNL